MSGIMKFWAVSGMMFWAGVGLCLITIGAQGIFEAIARRWREEK